MLRLLPIPERPANGRLYLCAMPGRRESLGDFIAAVTAEQIQHIVCLVSDEEIAKKSPTYLAAIKKTQIPGLLWRFPIPDCGIPKDTQALDHLLAKIRELLEQGESVVVHCAGGHGRTGMVAILLLARMGVELGEAISRLRIAGSGPDTEEQRRFLTVHANPGRAAGDAGVPPHDKSHAGR